MARWTPSSATWTGSCWPRCAGRGAPGPDCDPPPAHVPVKTARPAEREAALGGHVAGDLAADGHVGPFDRGLDRGAGVDGHVAGGLELAFHGPRDLEVALDVEAALERVTRPEA